MLCALFLHLGQHNEIHLSSKMCMLFTVTCVILECGLQLVLFLSPFLSISLFVNSVCFIFSLSELNFWLSFSFFLHIS